MRWVQYPILNVNIKLAREESVILRVKWHKGLFMREMSYSSPLSDILGPRSYIFPSILS